ncbi:MAG: M1 family aminopeptidase [Candidatus Cloacimonetes bacterium]|nr:T9SS type A sorting domain-containing protein [Candidatus Cloacimonadota bacterium]MDD2506189.1 M1 family aminopeptidase [Candidatus Cloacimonadota bacterium]MDD4147772.1 M1 family aminopeptidase [Candidatus Cloacimonadota bacterium]MDD4559359.1 M1 family aminopeptidase [Candidatus Cloacimonadota bacterium]
MKQIYIIIILLAICGMLIANPHFPTERYRHTKPFFPQERFYTAKADSETGFDVQKYTINLSISQSPNFISGSVHAEVLAESALSAISYNLVGLSVNSVELNGVVVPYTHEQGIVHIPLSVQDGENFTTKVYYSGTPQLSGAPYNVGMIFRPNSVFTVSDPDAARYWWPCYDHPWDKAVVDLIITMRSDWKVAANGLRESIVDNGNGTSTTTWRGENPMTTYLACITCGDFDEVQQSAMHGELPILNFVNPAQYNNALSDFANLPDMIDYFSILFGDYPFEKYGNATVSISTFSAMEHQTMTTLGNFIVDGQGTYELIIAHELAHQWFGNAVSFLDFNDVWLSEGFATYSEQLWTDKRYGWQASCDYVLTNFHNYYVNWENSNGPATIYNPDFGNYFAPPSYEKAACVLHMLRLKLGDADFFELLQTYYESFKHGNAVTAEFKAMAETISGQDLDQFFEQWIFGSGIPQVEYGVFLKPATQELKIVATSSSPTSTQFNLDIPFLVSGPSSSDSLLVLATPQGHVNLFQGIEEPLEISANHNNWTLMRSIVNQLPDLHTCLATSGAVHLVWDDFPGAVSYDVYRRLEDTTNWIKVNTDPILNLSYVDDDVENQQHYEYALKAIDAEGFSSMMSPVLPANPVEFSFVNDILIIDETRDGNGNPNSPTDAMVDDFYAAMLDPFEFDTWDFAQQNLPDLQTMGSYKVVLWHDDEMPMHQIGVAEDLLSSYMLGGGKLILSGWKTPSALSEVFWQRFVPSIELYYDNPACLISAESNEYPHLYVDPAKLVGIWNGMLPMIYSFEGDFTEMYSGNFAPGSVGIDKSIAFETGNLVFFGFPLYFMQEEGVRTLLQQLAMEFVGSATEDQIASLVTMNLTTYPNPFNPSAEIAFDLSRAMDIELCLYNLRGQKVETLAQGMYPKGRNQISFDGTGLSSGVYLLRIKAEGKSISRRITLMK